MTNDLKLKQCVVAVKMTDAELMQKNKEMFVTCCYNLRDDLDSLLAKYAAHGFESGWDAARANPDPRVEKLVEALKEISKSLDGDFRKTVDAEIAETALAEWEKGDA